MNSWYPVIFIVLAIAMAVGPVLMIRPSKRQQRLSHLRAKALKLGLRVHLLPLAESSTVPAYCLPWQENKKNQSSSKNQIPQVSQIPQSRQVWILKKMAFSHELHFQQRWDWLNHSPADNCFHAAIRHYLDAVPAGLAEHIQAIGNGPQGLCCYWDEIGGEEALDHLQTGLLSLSEALLGKASAGQ